MRRFYNIRCCFISAIIAFVILSVDYWVMNQPYTFVSEKVQLQLFEYVIKKIRNRQVCHASDSVLMIDVHYDKKFVTERGQTPTGKWFSKGEVPVTDRDKLYRLLKHFEDRGNDYRYIILDVCFDENTRQTNDTVLWNLLARMPRLVVAKGESGIASPLFASKIASDQFNTTLWETDFLKYSFYVDTTQSIALKVYSDITNNSLNNYGPLWFDNGRLARASVVLTWELVDYRDRFYLSDLINEYDSGVSDDWDGNPKDKYILIGDFIDDVHPTFYEELPGTLLHFNAYTSLLRHHHLLNSGLILLLFVYFWILVWLTLNQNHLFSWLCSLWGYFGFLMIFCFVIYICFNEVYDILINTSFFYVLKTALKAYNSRCMK